MKIGGKIIEDYSKEEIVPAIGNNNKTVLGNDN